MAVRLLVTKRGSSSLPDTYVFEHDRISIGRDSSSHLILPDPKRVVSKQHAEIACRKGAYQLFDLGSKNFTYLNDERIQPGQPYELKGGDSLRIGEYELTFEPVIEEVHDYDRTVFDASFVNPFEEEAVQLVRALSSIQAKYMQEAPARRADALRDALEQAGGLDSEHEVNVLVARLIGVSPEAASREEAEASPPQAVVDVEEPVWGDFSIDEAPQTQARTAVGPVRSKAKLADAQGAGGSETGVLMSLLARLIGIPWQFRHEFIGQTIAQSPESPMYYSGDPDALQAFLFDTSLPQAERDRRLELLEQWVDELVLHQLALLDGYKASALQGVERLLQELDPEAVEGTLLREGVHYRMLPLLRRAQVAARLLEKRQELQREDWSYAERTVFRPAFIKAYLARMTAQHR